MIFFFYLLHSVSLSNSSSRSTHSPPPPQANPFTMNYSPKWIKRHESLRIKAVTFLSTLYTFPCFHPKPISSPWIIIPTGQLLVCCFVLNLPGGCVVYFNISYISYISIVSSLCCFRYVDSSQLSTSCIYFAQPIYFNMTPIISLALVSHCG